MAPADTIIKSVSERPNGMFPPGNHVRTCGKSVTRASEAGFGIISRKFHFLKKFQKKPKILGFFETFWFFLKLFEKILVFRKKRDMSHALRADTDLRAYTPCYRRDSTAGAPADVLP